MQNEAAITELEKGYNGIRRFKIENGSNTWQIELCHVGIIDLHFKLSGFPNYKIFLDGRVESNFKNKTSTRVNGECKFNLLNDLNKWETVRLKNLISIVKSRLVKGYEWRK
jgi:hypothetical protein